MAKVPLVPESCGIVTWARATLVQPLEPLPRPAENSLGTFFKEILTPILLVEGIYWVLYVWI